VTITYLGALVARPVRTSVFAAVAIVAPAIAARRPAVLRATRFGPLRLCALLLLRSAGLRRGSRGFRARRRLRRLCTRRRLRCLCTRLGARLWLRSRFRARFGTLLTRLCARRRLAFGARRSLAATRRAVLRFAACRRAICLWAIAFGAPFDLLFTLGPPLGLGARRALRCRLRARGRRCCVAVIVALGSISLPRRRRRCAFCG
jgi:hypothetical protein